MAESTIGAVEVIGRELLEGNSPQPVDEPFGFPSVETVKRDPNRERADVGDTAVSTDVGPTPREIGDLDRRMVTGRPGLVRVEGPGVVDVVPQSDRVGPSVVRRLEGHRDFGESVRVLVDLRRVLHGQTRWDVGGNNDVALPRAR